MCLISTNMHTIIHKIIHLSNLLENSVQCKDASLAGRNSSPAALPQIIQLNSVMGNIPSENILSPGNLIIFHCTVNKVSCSVSLTFSPPLYHMSISDSNIS